MPLTMSSLSQAVGYYRRLCEVEDTESAQANRLRALSILREALTDDHRLWQCLCLVRDHGEIESKVIAEGFSILQSNASSRLEWLWGETVDIPGGQREHIFLDRWKVNLPEGGMKYRYRLSALGVALMQVESC